VKKRRRKRAGLDDVSRKNREVRRGMKSSEAEKMKNQVKGDG